MEKTCHFSEEMPVKHIHQVDADNIYKGIGCTKGYVYVADLKENARDMKNKPPRRVCDALMDDVKNEVDKMETEGIRKKYQQAYTFLQPYGRNQTTRKALHLSEYNRPKQSVGMKTLPAEDVGRDCCASHLARALERLLATGSIREDKGLFNI